MKHGKLFAIFLIIFLLSLLISNVVAAKGLIIPEIEQGGVGESVNFTFTKTEIITNPVLHLKTFFGTDWTNISLSTNAEDVFGSANGNLFWREGLYKYYVEADNNMRYPEEGFATFLITNKEQTYRNWSKIFLENDANGTNQDWHCAVHSGTSQGFKCFWSHMNTLEALRFAKGYRLTNNETYKEWSLNLTFSEYNNYSGYSSEEKLCDQYKQDFNCSSYSLGSGYTYGGAFRQGENINFLVDVFKELRNQSVLNLAINYSKGTAEECNVWNNSFNCSSELSDVSDAENQGAMILGYLNLYSVTENETYKNITRKLVDQAIFFTDRSPLLLEALSKYFEMFGNETVYKEILRRADDEKDVCVISTCEPEEKAKQLNAYLQVFKQTGNEDYLLALYKKLLRPANTCDALTNNYQCEDSTQQGLLNAAYIDLFEELPATKLIYDAYKDQLLHVNEEIPIKFSIKGYQTNITFFYRNVNDITWKNKSVNYWEWQTNIPSNETSVEGIYEFYFQSEQKRYPENQGTKLVVIPVSYEEYLDPLRGLENNDSTISCDPHGLNPKTPDYNCQREHFQSWETKSFLSTLDTYNKTEISKRNSLKNIAINLGNNRIDQDINNYQTESTCEFLDDDYYCQTHAIDFSDDYLKPGGIRQSMMIQMFSKLYQETKNITYRENAYNYLIENNDACDPFEGDYSCETQSDGTTNTEVTDYEAYAYWKAYEIFGEDKFKQIAENLTQKLLTYVEDNYKEITGLTLWKAYELTGLQKYFDNASAVSDKLVDDCTSSYDCEAHKLALNTLLMMEGTKQTKGLSSSYLNKALMNLRFISPANANQYCDPIKNSFACHTPEDQGLMLLSYAVGVSEMIDLGNTTYTIGVFSNHTINYLSNFSVTCQVNNTNRVGSYEVSIISPFKIENASANLGTVSSTLKKIKFTGLEDNDTRNATWILNADWGGDYQVQCVVEDFQNSTNVTINNLYDVIEQTTSQEEVFLKQDETKNISINLTNKVRFDLEDVILNYSTNRLMVVNNSNQTNTSNSSKLEIIGLNISDDTAVIINNTRINLTYLFTGVTETINVTIKSNFSDDYKLISEFNSTYDGYDRKEIVVHTYNESFLKSNLETSEVLSINEPFKINLSLNNTRNFTIRNLSIHLVLSDNFTKTNSPNNINFVNLSNETYFNESYKPYSNQDLVWDYYPTKVGTYQLKIILNTTDPDENYLLTKNIEVLGNVYNLSDDLTPSNTNFQPGSTYTLRLNISQNSVKNLTNVTAQIIVPSGVDIINIDTNKTIYLNETWYLSEAINQTNDSVISLINQTDNISLNQGHSFLNISFNITNHNNSYNFSSAKIEMKINNSINKTTNYKINITRENLTEMICSFDINQSNETIKECNIPIENLSTIINLTIKTNDTTIVNSVKLKTNSTSETSTGTKISTNTLKYDVLEPSEVVNSRWEFKLQTKEDKTIQINISSDQGANTIYSIDFNGPEEEVSSSSSSGGGGGSMPPSPDTMIIYNYSNYNYCNQIRPHNKLYPFSDFENECLFNETQELKLLTENFLYCYQVKRTYENHTTTLSIQSKNINETICEMNLSKVYVYDIINKNIFNTTQDFVLKTKNNFAIVKKDPELLYELKFLNGSESKRMLFNNISYFKENSSNKLSQFNRPIIFVKPKEIELHEENITETIKPIKQQNKTSKNETKKKETTKQKIQKYITISSEKIQDTLVKTYERSRSKIKYFLIIIFLTGLILYLNKKGLLNEITLSKSSKKRRHKKTTLNTFSMFWIRFLVVINRLFAKKERLFVLDSSMEELAFLKNKDSHRLIVDIFFLFKELDLKKISLSEKGILLRDENGTVKEIIKNLRLIRLSLTKLFDELDNKTNKKELDKLLKIVEEKNVYWKKILRGSKIKQKNMLEDLLKDISYLLKLFEKQKQKMLSNPRQHVYFWKMILKQLKTKKAPSKTINKEKTLKERTIDFYIELKQFAKLIADLQNSSEEEKNKLTDQLSVLKKNLEKEFIELENLFETKKLTEQEKKLERTFNKNLKKLYDKLKTEVANNL